MQRLSFGTVMNVLQQCKADKPNKTELTMAVINIIIPTNSYNNPEKRLKDTNYTRKLNFIYHCETNLESMFNEGKPLVRRKPNQTIIKQFEKKVVPLITESKHRLVILALCDMIEKDCTLDSQNGVNTSRFKTYTGKPIQEFLNDKKYNFSDFLTRICLYAIYEVNNRACEDWVKQLSNEYGSYEKGFKNYIDGFENNKREILIWSTAGEKEQSQNTTSQAMDNRTALTPSEEDTLCGEPYKQYRERTNTLAVRDIGQENEICLCCENWTGDMENAFNAPHGSLGKCSLKNEEMLSTNPMCKCAIPSLQRANKRWASIFDSQ